MQCVMIHLRIDCRQHETLQNLLAPYGLHPFEPTEDRLTLTISSPDLAPYPTDSVTKKLPFSTNGFASANTDEGVLNPACETVGVEPS